MTHFVAVSGYIFKATHFNLVANYSREIFMTVSLFRPLPLLSLLFATSLLLAPQVNAQQVSIPHLKQGIVVDGKMDEAHWKKAQMIELKYEIEPNDKTAARVKTVAYIYEDGESLHVAIIASDPNPKDIVANLSNRDWMFQDDWSGIIIDTFNDNRSAYEFFVNPFGVQGDLRAEENNGWREDSSWDAIWESAGQINKDGYIVEMSIPFKALRFPEQEGPLTWNLGLMRIYPRDNRYQFANYDGDKSKTCSICQFDSIVGFENITPSKNVQITPTITANRSDTREPNEDEWNNGSLKTEPGVDLRWGITPDMVLNATVNPDFSQVEADSTQLDVNNTFSLFVEEKRPFFLDGADYFNSQRFNLVHTRNIARPDYGVKLTGKSGDHSYAALVANDESTNFLMPGNEGSSIATIKAKSEIAILRYKMDVGERSSIGAHITNRQSTDYKNTVASIDGSHWFNDTDRLTYQAVWSDSDNPNEIVEDFNVAKSQQGNAISLDIRRETKEFNLKAGYNDVSEDFRADLGFMGRSNFKKFYTGGEYRWYGEKNDWLNRWGFFGDIDRTEDQDGNMLEEEAEIHLNLRGRHQFFSNMGVVVRNYAYDGQIFKEEQVMGHARIRPTAKITVSGFARAGKQIDFANSQLGDILVMEGSLSWEPTHQLALELDYNFRELEVDDQTLFTAKSADAKISYQFDIKSSVRLVLQHVNVERDLALYNTPSDYDAVYKGFNTQLLYSYKVNPQTLVFVGYADNGYQDDDLKRVERTGRTVFAKFSYAWQM